MSPKCTPTLSQHVQLDFQRRPSGTAFQRSSSGRWTWSESLIIVAKTTADGSETRLNHLGCVKPCRKWAKLHINWYRMFAISRSLFPKLSLIVKGFLLVQRRWKKDTQPLRWFFIRRCKNVTLFSRHSRNKLTFLRSLGIQAVFRV